MGKIDLGTHAFQFRKNAVKDNKDGSLSFTAFNHALYKKKDDEHVSFT